jgi:hypothetical protein
MSEDPFIENTPTLNTKPDARDLQIAMLTRERDNLSMQLDQLLLGGNVTSMIILDCRELLQKLPPTPEIAAMVERINKWSNPDGIVATELTPEQFAELEKEQQK